MDILANAGKLLGGLAGVLGICAAVAAYGAWHFSGKEAVLQQKEREREREDDRLEMMSLNPINAPIKSIRIKVALDTRGEFDDDWLSNWSNEALASQVHFDLWVKEGLIAQIACTKFSTNIIRYPKRNDDGTVTHTKGRVFTMTFEWPHTDFSSILFGDTNAIENSKPSTKALDKVLVAGALDLPGHSMKGGKIVKGSCELIINGNISRVMSVDSKYELDTVWCTPNTKHAQEFNKADLPREILSPKPNE